VGSAEALERFERQTAWPMPILSVAIIPLLVIPLVMDLSPSADSTVFAIDVFIWAIFALEYGIRLYLAPAKGRFVRSNVIDLIVVLIPFLRPLRVAASLQMLRLLRASVVVVLLLRATKALRNVLTRQKLHYTLLVASCVTVGAGLIVAEIERVTTVGYGDAFPTTAVGRAFAVVLMLFGVSLFGLLAASLASFLIERGVEQGRADPEHLEIIERLERIERRLDER
jgi:voltage-gated potassium channel